MPKNITLKRGSSIAYIPTHIERSIPKKQWLDHKDTQIGFVTSIKGNIIFCRYWNLEWKTLRTRANSEGANRENVYPLNELVTPCRKKMGDFPPKKVINAWLTIIDYERKA